MKVVDNKIIFDVDEKVICINRNRHSAVGTVQKLKNNYTVKLDKDYLELSSLKWDYVIPFDIHLKEYLEENSIDEQYELIKEHLYGIIANNGRKL